MISGKHCEYLEMRAITMKKIARKIYALQSDTHTDTDAHFCHGAINLHHHRYFPKRGW